MGRPLGYQSICWGTLEGWDPCLWSWLRQDQCPEVSSSLPQVCQLMKQWGNWVRARKLLLIGIGLMTKKTIPFQYLALKLLWAVSLHKDLTLKFPQIPLIFSTHWAEQVKVVSTEPVPLALSLVPGSQGQMRAQLEGGRFVPWQYWHLEGVGPRAQYLSGLTWVVKWSPGHKPGLKLACACPFLPWALAVKDGYKTPVAACLLPDWALASDRKRTGFFWTPLPSSQLLAISKLQVALVFVFLILCLFTLFVNLKGEKTPLIPKQAELDGKDRFTMRVVKP